MTQQDIDTLDRHTRALLVALGYRDQPTRRHSERVGDLALDLGRQCALNSGELAMLGIAANFHDIGKLGIPDSILGKPACLDESEKEFIKQHCLIGEAIMLATEADAAGAAATAIRHHHEHFDGRGYPDCLAGEDIPVFSRIIGVVDSYDAMAETRHYHHKARRHDEIIAVMDEETGAKHDPYLMRQFRQMIEGSRFRVA